MSETLFLILAIIVSYFVGYALAWKHAYSYYKGGWR